jgi:hypothetical protein
MYLDIERLRAVDRAMFRTQNPYPWINPAGLLTEAGYQQLLATMPAVELFTSHFGGIRVHGQQKPRPLLSPLSRRSRHCRAMERVR